MQKLAALTLAALLAFSPAIAQEKVWHHGGSLIGEPKYPAGFEKFDYVNPDAPIGGEVRLSSMGGFDTFNPILPQGEPADGIGLVFETLTTPSLDETSTQYGNLAEAFSYPDDFSSVTFRMNPRAKWADGEPVTAADVVWTFNKVIELNPSQANYFANVTKAEVTAPGEVTFTFDKGGNRELPNIMGQLIVLPQHWWEGTGPDGKPRDISKPGLEPPLGSGPYKLVDFSPGASITYERDPNYWGLKEPFNIGQNNFQTLKYEYFLDTTAEFEGFKGDEFDWWDENLALRWQGGYDFEELDKLRFFGQYDRINSYFYGTEFASSGLPQGEELEILNSVKDLVPASVFTTEYKNPVNGDTTKLRQSLRTANEILTKAGYTLNGNQLIDPSGTPVTFEILLNGPTIEPIATAFQTNLKRLGINASIRSVDSPQYIERAQNRDYDMIYTGWAQSLSPGNEQRDFWGSASAAQSDSRNYAGISDKGVDALIDKIIFAEDRETLIAATRALDRVLLAHHYTVPTYTLRKSRIARWDRFSHPDELPEFSIGFPTVWWYDEAKAAKTGAAKN